MVFTATTAIPELLQLLDLQGALVSIDAMACQTKIAKTIIEQKGDYLLAVKGNQGNLSKAVQQGLQRLTQRCLLAGGITD